MSSPLSRKVSLSDVRSARQSGAKLPMLTCYDFTMARLMQQAGVPLLLVGDSAANVILGHDTTLPVSLEFMIEIAAAVRRGAPLAFLTADMPFGTYGTAGGRGFENVIRMVKETGCDCVKIEVQADHLPLVRELSASGVAVMAHLGLRPQSVNVVGGYRARGRTAEEARQIVELAVEMEGAGAVALLLEAVTPPVSERVAARTTLPVIGCGGGPACHGHVVVTHDLLGLTDHRPKFVPDLGKTAVPLVEAFGSYVRAITELRYPAAEHLYEMPKDELAKFQRMEQV